MSEERLANALTRARLAADRIDRLIASRPFASGTDDRSDALRAAVTPILAQLDQMIADAEGRT